MGWWPQGGGPRKVVDGRWECDVTYGETKDLGCVFEIAVVAVGSSVNDFLLTWCRGAAMGSRAPIDFSFRVSASIQTRREVGKTT